MLLENYYSLSVNLVKLQDTKLIHRNLLHSYTLTIKDQKDIYMEFKKMVTTTLYAKQKKRHRCTEQNFGP